MTPKTNLRPYQRECIEMMRSTPSPMYVMPKRCDECLFSSRKLVSDARRDEILEDCNRTGKAFECHKATIAEEKRTCRAFFDENASLVVRLAKLYGWYEFKDVIEDYGNV